MAEVKGKFITLSCMLLKTKPKAQEVAIKTVKELTGKDFGELEQEGWYDTKIMDAVFQSIRDNSSKILADAAIKHIGQKVYPTIEKTIGLPKDLNTPLDFIKYEAQGFQIEHRGADVKPRKIIEEKEGKVIIEATSPGYDCTLIEGVYEGILEMCGVRDREVIQTRCVKKGDSDCEYLIKWKVV